jgi:hypothetical protein
MTIAATNALQKVTAEGFHFYQHSAFDMMYTQEVSFFTRADSLADWGVTHTRPVPRDDGVRFQNFSPLSDSVVSGSFSGSFNGGGGIEKGEGDVIRVKGSFMLVFIQ